MKLLLCLLFLSAASAEKVLYTVVYGNVTGTVKTQIENSETTLLAAMDSATPATMSVYSTGQSFTTETYSTTGGTTTDNSVRKLFPTERDLQVNTCPNSCKNSGSNYCKSLGCAYCTRCRRNLRSLMSATSTTNIATSIKSELDSDLASFCSGVSGCKLWTKVYEVNPDGTLTQVA
jgi:hypothetical protein